jgi:protein-disulfide isomerase
MRRRALVLVVLTLAASCKRNPGPGGSNPAPSLPPEGSVAEIDGTPITAAELEERVGNRLARIRQEEYETRRQALDEIITDRLLAAEAKRRGLSVEDLVHDEVDNQVKDPDPALVKGLYEQNKARFASVAPDKAMANIRDVLKSRDRAAKKTELGQRLRAKAAVKISLEAPRIAVPVPASAPTLGPDRAPVVIVQYADYQCPFCHRAEGTIEQILSRNAGKVQLVHRDFPLDGHPRAFPAARAARCAGEQGRFWDYHRSLMTDQGSLDEADLKARAQALKLESGAFASCLASDRFDAAIRASLDEGVRAGVNATPTYFVNGRLLAGAVPFDEFQQVVDAELGRAR